MTVSVHDGKDSAGNEDTSVDATRSVTIGVTDEDERPEAPGAPTVSAASSTSLSVSWTAPTNTGPAITDYDWRWEGAVRDELDGEDGYHDHEHERDDVGLTAVRPTTWGCGRRTPRARALVGLRQRHHQYAGEPGAGVHRRAVHPFGGGEQRHGHERGRGG